MTLILIYLCWNMKKCTNIFSCSLCYFSFRCASIFFQRSRYYFVFFFFKLLSLNFLKMYNSRKIWLLCNEFVCFFSARHGTPTQINSKVCFGCTFARFRGLLTLLREISRRNICICLFNGLTDCNRMMIANASKWKSKWERN